MRTPTFLRPRQWRLAVKNTAEAKSAKIFQHLGNSREDLSTVNLLKHDVA